MTMESEARKLVTEGDVVFPYVWGDPFGSISIDPIVLFWHDEMKYYYTTAMEPTLLEIYNLDTHSKRSLSPNIRLVGWANPNSYFGRGLKVFLPATPYDGNDIIVLKPNEAIEIDKVYNKSAFGNLVEISVRPSEKAEQRAKRMKSGLLSLLLPGSEQKPLEEVQETQENEA